MEVVNPFILKNKERMIVFLDQLSNVADPFPVAVDYTIINSNANNNSDTGQLFLKSLRFRSLILFIFIGRDLATLHHICVSHLHELQNMSKVNLSIKKLVTVTEMLSNHKDKYLDMIS